MKKPTARTEAWQSGTRPVPGELLPERHQPRRWAGLRRTPEPEPLNNTEAQHLLTQLHEQTPPAEGARGLIRAILAATKTPSFRAGYGKASLGEADIIPGSTVPGATVDGQAVTRVELVRNMTLNTEAPHELSHVMQAYVTTTGAADETSERVWSLSWPFADTDAGSHLTGYTNMPERPTSIYDPSKSDHAEAVNQARNEITALLGQIAAQTTRA